MCDKCKGTFAVTSQKQIQGGSGMIYDVETKSICQCYWEQMAQIDLTKCPKLNIETICKEDVK